jgi:hypothetical protein
MKSVIKKIKNRYFKVSYEKPTTSYNIPVVYTYSVGV